MPVINIPPSITNCWSDPAFWTEEEKAAYTKWLQGVSKDHPAQGNKTPWIEVLFPPSGTSLLA